MDPVDPVPVENLLGEEGSLMVTPSLPFWRCPQCGITSAAAVVTKMTCIRCGIDMERVSDRPPLDFLTDRERNALRLTADLASELHAIILDGGDHGQAYQAAWDWAEMATRIHDIQHAVMAQAAARAYPTEYRLLGGRL